MKILALDAATEACSVALLIDADVQERYEIAPREHAQLLLPMAKTLLADAQLKLSDLDGIAVGRGPGAFTGIRIAMSMAQGLALGAELPIAPVSNLAALALRNYRLHGAPKSLVVQDARMQEVYWAPYVIDAQGLPALHQEERVEAPHNLSADQYAAEWSPAGGGWLAYPEELASVRQNLAAATLECHPHAEDIALLAAAMLQAGQGVDAGLAQPSYVRNNVAKKSTKGRLPAK